MLRYFCRDFTGNAQGNRQSMEFVFRPMPPLMTIIIYDYGTRETWGIRQLCWNAQSRQSLASLRAVEAWRSNCGFDGHGEFRAISPTSLIDELPLVLSFDVEVSWFPGFANLTTQIGTTFSLFSVRPESGTGGWTRLQFGPPNVEYITSQDIANHLGRPDRPVVSVTAPVTLVQVNQHTVVTTAGSADASRGSNDPPPPDVEIIEEVPRSVPFSRPALEAIPYSNHPHGGQENNSAIIRMHAVQRPITLEEFDPLGMLPFELAMQFVREENAARLGAHYGTRLASVNFVAMSENHGTAVRTRRDNQSENRPIIQEILPEVNNQSSHEIIPEPVSNPAVLVTETPTRLAPAPITAPVVDSIPIVPQPTVVPRPPATPKPMPPPFRPTQLPLISRPRLTPAMALTMSSISNLSARFHPRLRTIEYLRPDQLAESRVTRTGTVNPPLPKADSISTTTYGSPPSSLRTTPEGIRLEITPVSMVLQTQPENHVPSTTETSESPPADERPSSPELNPDL